MGINMNIKWSPHMYDIVKSLSTLLIFSWFGWVKSKIDRRGSISKLGSKEKVSIGCYLGPPDAFSWKIFADQVGKKRDKEKMGGGE